MTSLNTVRLRGAASAATAILLLLCMGGASAQMYKWVDAKGAVHFSDKPPPADARAAAIKPSAGGASATPLPYDLAEAARKHPVTLYTGAQCSVCDQARNYLNARGIPFAEKTVLTRADEAKLRAAGSAGEVPLLLVGRSKSIGFESSAWAALLSDAGYPGTRMLPANYQNPPATPAAPAPLQAAAPADEAAPAQRRRGAALPPSPPSPPPAPAETTAPPGFRF